MAGFDFPPNEVSIAGSCPSTGVRDLNKRDARIREVMSCRHKIVHFIFHYYRIMARNNEDINWGGAQRGHHSCTTTYNNNNSNMIIMIDGKADP